MNKIAIVLTTAIVLLFSSCEEETGYSEENNTADAVASESSEETTGITNASKNATVTIGEGVNGDTIRPSAKAKSVNTATTNIYKDAAYDGTLKLFHVEGIVMGGGRANVVLQKLSQQRVIPLVSNTATIDGRWGFNYEIVGPELFALKVPAGAIHFVAKPYDTIFITSDLQTVSHYEIEGSPESVHLREMYYILDNANAKKRKLREESESAATPQEAKRLAELRPIRYEAIESQKHADLRDLIKRIDMSFTAILASLYLDPARPEDMKVMEGVANKFEGLFPESEYYQDLKEKIQPYQPISIGKIAPQVMLEAPNGKAVKLTDYRGKYVMLDFWASWCRPCRAENPKLKKVYDKYKNKGPGFEILAVSLDDNKNDWQDAISKDGLSWVHASDLLGYNSAAAQTYIVNSIPSSFLLDPEGRIIAKDVRAGELERELAKHLK